MAWHLHAGGLSAPASFASSGDANTFDDYQEGTSTATVLCDSGTVTLQGSYNTWTYTQWGRLVQIGSDIRVQSTSSPSGGIHLVTPFTAEGHTGSGVGAYSVHFGGSCTYLFYKKWNDTTTMTLYGGKTNAARCDMSPESGDEYYISAVFNIK